MSMPVLIEVYDETRRLAIAGSAVAAGDFRLKKLIPPLQKSGEKAPVFGKVAQAVQAVVESTEKTASAALLELTTLVNAILYTQGETGIAGDFKALETTDLGGQPTQASARVLKPLLEALSTTGSGRIELVRDAYERGTFKDLRLIKPALAALDDPYPELGEFIAKNVLPMYGNSILPELRATLDLKKGSGGHVNRLQLMHKLDAEGSRDLVQQALADGSKELKVAAIECLGTSDEDLAYLLEQTRAKAKDVRAASLRALAIAGVNTAEVIDALKKAIAGADVQLIIERVKACKLPEIRDYVLEQAEEKAAEILKLKDKEKQGSAVNRLRQLVLAMDESTDPRVETFLLGLFNDAGKYAAVKSEPSGSDLNELIAQVLSQGTPRMQKQLVAAYKTLRANTLPPAILAALSIMSPAEFYDEFSPALAGLSTKAGKRSAADIDLATSLRNALHSGTDHSYYLHWHGASYMYARRRTGARRELDPRWLDTAVKVEAIDLVCDLARPGHAAANKFLSEQLPKTRKPGESHQLLQTMARIQHPEAADAIIEVLKKEAKGTYFYMSYWYSKMIVELPASTLTKFEALLTTLPEKMVDQLVEAIMTLKTKPE